MTLRSVSTFADLELVECVVRREAEAFDELYRRHARSVGATSRMVLGNSPSCEDVVAEVFLAFWLKPDDFDVERGSLLGFLRMKARSRSIDVVRTDMARRRREISDCRDGTRAVGGSDDDNSFSGVAERLQRTISALIEREREPIKLAFFTGMTYKDVAEHLAIPEGTVKARIRSGLHHARVIFDSECLPSP